MQHGKVFGDPGNFSIKFADYLNQAVLFFPQAKQSNGKKSFISSRKIRFFNVKIK